MKDSTSLIQFSGNLDDILRVCEGISKSAFCPKFYVGKPWDILCAIQYGLEINEKLKPMQALQMISVINGKPCVYGDGLLAICQSSSDCEYIKESFCEESLTATCIAKRKNHPEVVSTFSKEDAIKAGLWGKEGPWKLYPKRMLGMRARGFALRDAFAYLLRGVITEEEAMDYEKIKTLPQIKEVIKITPETKRYLSFMLESIGVSEEELQHWYDKLKVKNLEDFSEEQALLQIKNIEKKYSNLRQKFDKMNNAENENQLYEGIENE